MDDSLAVHRLAAEIVQYLADHPDAVDTAEGILRWWLPSRGMESSPETLRRALEALVEAHTIGTRELPDGRSVYGRVSDNGSETRD